MSKTIFTLATSVIECGVVRVESNHADDTVDMYVEDDYENRSAEMAMNAEELDSLIEMLQEARRMQFG